MPIDATPRTRSSSLSMTRQFKAPPELASMPQGFAGTFDQLDDYLANAGHSRND